MMVWRMGSLGFREAVGVWNTIRSAARSLDVRCSTSPASEEPNRRILPLFGATRPDKRGCAAGLWSQGQIRILPTPHQRSYYGHRSSVRDNREYYDPGLHGVSWSGASLR